MDRMTRSSSYNYGESVGNRQGASCACHSSGNSDLLQRLREIDFAIYETALYLDSYPHSAEALAHYHSLLQMHKALTEEYQSKTGPLTIFGNKSTDSWDWTNTPWPWE
ncbi:MAG: spore coat protein CotJB [Clostridia bacterium]|nr:spore coat protein CotJB [Clostridia bacterium]